MEEPKIIQLLNILTPTERVRLNFFAQSRIIKKKELNVLNYLLKCIAENKQVSLEYCQQLLHQNGKKMYKLFNQFTDLTEAFLAMEQLNSKQHNLLKYILLIKRLQNSGSERLFMQAVKKAKRLLDDGEANGLLFFHLRRWLIDESFFHPAIAECLEEGNQIEDLDSYLCLIILHYTCRKMANNRLNLSSGKSPLLKEALRLTSSQKTKQIPLLHLYSLSVRLFSDFEGEKYLEFKELTLKKVLHFEEKERSFLFKLLINHTAHAVRLDNGYVVDSLEVYRFGISNRLLEDGGYLIKEHLMNYVSIACSIGRIKTAKLFLEEHQNRLHETKRKKVIKICMSRIMIAQGQFKKAFGALYSCRFKDVHFWFTARSYRLMACYEWEVSGREMVLNGKNIFLQDELEAFRLGLTRIKAKLEPDNERFIANFRFYEMVKKLSQFQPHYPLYPEQLEHELKACDLVACRRWLGEKVRELRD